MATDITPSSIVQVSPIMFNQRAQAAIASENQRINTTQPTALAMEEQESSMGAIATSSILNQLDISPLMLRSAENRGAGRVFSDPINLVEEESKISYNAVVVSRQNR